MCKPLQVHAETTPKRWCPQSDAHTCIAKFRYRMYFIQVVYYYTLPMINQLFF